MTPPPDLQAVRDAADIIELIDRDTLAPTLTISSYAKLMEARDYILATIPADHSQPITEQWLREVWGWKWSGKITETKLAYGHYAATLRDGAWWLSWGNNGETWPRGITTRYQFAQLCQSLGVTPKTKTKEV